MEPDFKKGEVYLLYNKARNNIGFPLKEEVLEAVRELIETEDLYQGYLFWDMKINNLPLRHTAMRISLC